jgi:hypothetical protein
MHTVGMKAGCRHQRGAGTPHPAAEGAAEMRRFMPVMWFGFWLNFFSGIALLIGYPTKALTNPVFYLKLTLIAAGVWLVGRIRDRMDTGAKGLAIASLVCWGGAITAGRLLAYTYRHLMAGIGYTGG